MFIMNGEALQENRERLRKGDNALRAAYADLLADADGALKEGPFSVVNKTRTPPSGDKHDYMSVGPYWWPDPEKPDGLPYINRDGEVNPDYGGAGTDARRKNRMVRKVRDMSRAYFFSGEEKYAERAALLLRTWFLDSETRMNPNLDFGQAIPGRTQGRGIGIIETHCFTDVVESVGLLEGSKAWTEVDQKGMEAWFGEYLEWLLNSKNGRDEAKGSNNHGTYYDVQVACFALFVGKPEMAKQVLEAAKARRIATQIEPDGSQPHELRRTKSFMYSMMNLAGMFALARLGEHVGLDLWHYETPDGRSIRRALDYMAPYADAAKSKDWTYKQITNLNPMNLLPVLWEAGFVYAEPRYHGMISLLPKDEVRKSRFSLLYRRLETP